MQDGLEVDALLGAVAKRDCERVRTNDTEPCHPMDCVNHDLPERFDLDGRLTGLQEIPVRQQFRPVDLRPGLNQPLLGLWQVAAQTLDRVHREYRRLILVVRVEVRSVMLPASFDKHPDDNPEEPR